MANKITITNIRPQEGLVSPLSRYINSTVIYYGDDNKMTFTTYKKDSYTPSPSDKFTVISPGMEYRPDLMSKKVYGVVDFWWKIMEVNNISDVFDFKAGKTIRLPSDVY